MHKNNLLMKGIAFAIALLFVGLASASSINVSIDKVSTSKDTEFWALIFAVGFYYKHPEQNIPSMLACADNLYEVLVDSPNWQADHIHKVTASEATGIRLIRELLWLMRNEDSDDMSLIYLTSHGGPLYGSSGSPIDLPPKDEDDGFDEALAMHHGFERWYAVIWDDLLNFFLSLLDSEGVCLIVDSCHAGGFNDEPMFAGTIFEDYTAESFVQGFAGELAAQGRVVLMSCREDEVTYGSEFSDFLIYGFQGHADIWGNNDGIVSAEEAFDYAESQIWEEQHPTILDLYSGEYPVTYC